MRFHARTSARLRPRASVLCAVGIVLLTLCPVTSALAGPEEHVRILQYVEAEERMAVDLFTAFDAVYDSRPLSRIAAEERTHARIIDRVLDGERSLRGGYADYPGLVQDYWRWLAEGYRDLRSAAQVGIAVERQHLAIVDAAIAASFDHDTKRRLTRIRKEDARHLATFLQLLASTPPAQPCVTERC